MKSFLVLLLITFSYSQSETEKVKAVIQDSFDQVLANFEINKISDFYTEDFLLLESGHIWNTDSIIRILSSAKSKLRKYKRTNNFEFLSVKIFENRAWLAFHNTATIISPNQERKYRRWLESAVLVKEEGRWKIELLHSSDLDKLKM